MDSAEEFPPCVFHLGDPSGEEVSNLVREPLLTCRGPRRPGPWRIFVSASPAEVKPMVILVACTFATLAIETDLATFSRPVGSQRVVQAVHGGADVFHSAAARFGSLRPDFPTGVGLGTRPGRKWYQLWHFRIILWFLNRRDLH